MYSTQMGGVLSMLYFCMETLHKEPLLNFWLGRKNFLKKTSLVADFNSLAEVLTICLAIFVVVSTDYLGINRIFM